MIIKQKNLKIFNIEHDFIHDIFLNNDKIVLIGNNQYKKKIDLDNIQILNINDKIKNIETYQDTKSNDFFIKTYYLNEIYNEIVFTLNFKFNQYCELNHKLKLENVSIQLKHFDITKCITTVLNSKDINESIFYDWYNYYNEIGITTFVVYYNDYLNTLNQSFLDFVNKQKNIIVFEWNYVLYENLKLNIVNHCLCFIKKKSDFLLVGDINDYLITKDMNSVVKLLTHENLQYYVLNITYLYYINNKIVIYDTNNDNNIKYIINPKNVTHLNQDYLLSHKKYNNTLKLKKIYISILINEKNKDLIYELIKTDEFKKKIFLKNKDTIYNIIYVKKTLETYTFKNIINSCEKLNEYKCIINKLLKYNNENIIEDNLLEEKKTLHNYFKKKIISVIMYFDYIQITDKNKILIINYLKKALLNYHLNDYKIIIISDKNNASKDITDKLDIDFIDGSFFCENQKDEIYFHFYSNVCICIPSFINLKIYYLNQMYNISNTEYIFPDEWNKYTRDNLYIDINKLLLLNNNNYKIIPQNNYVYGIFLIATGKYINYLDFLILNIKNMFLTQNKRVLFITTDNISYIDKFKNLLDENFNIVTNYQACRGFPADTMYRFEYFLNFKDITFNFGKLKNIMDVDYLMFMNINLQINYKIDVLPIYDNKLFFTQHPGNIKENMFYNSIEKRKEVSCYVNIDLVNKEDIIYICGGFNGGKTIPYLTMCKKLKENTIKDDNNNIIAIWHDESQINWYRIQLDKDSYKIIDYIYCCPSEYYENTYINILKKNHEKIRNDNNNILVDFTDNFNKDLLRILYINYKHNNSKIILPILNNKYILSSRNGLLKNYFRIKVNNNILVSECNYQLVLNIDIIQKFVDKLNFNFNHIDITSFFEKYKNHTIVHISNSFEKYRKDIYHFLQNNLDTKFLVVFHNEEYFNDKVWDNVINIEKYTFKNDEEKIILLSQIDKQLFFNLNDVFIILMISKLYYKKQNEISWLYSFKNKNKETFNFIENNFKTKSIDTDLKPGFSFIIRAKNETLNVDYCLKTLEPILLLYPNSEIIFVDNNSTDDTFNKACSILYKYVNTLVLKYNVNVPPCGEIHKKITEENPKLSLGEYYRWCYSFSNKYNVIKWDCDFYCVLQNLLLMIQEYNLNTTDKDLSIWFSGKQVFVKDNEYYIDDKSYFLYNEPRIQSKINGFIYKDSPDKLWETPFTSYLINNEKKNCSYHNGFPTSYFLIRYIESKHKYNLFNNKNIYNEFHLLYKESTKESIINNIKNIPGLYQIFKNELSKNEMVIFYEMKHINILIKNFNKLKLVDERDIIIKKRLIDITHNNKDYKSDLYLNNNIILKKKHICILCLVCDKNKEKQENIKTHLLTLDIDFFLVKADENIEKPKIEGNFLYVNCDECYENLPKKILLAYKYLFETTDYSYFLKIDDDTTIEISILKQHLNNNFYNLDYMGAIAGGHVELNWHFGKCKSEYLNTKLYWNGYHGYWCGGGFGYILSRPAISILLKEKNFNYIYNEIYEDKAIGDILRKEGILPCFEFLPDLKISKKIGMKGDNYIFTCNH